MNLKKLSILQAAVGLAVLAAPSAKAISYNDGDVLLVFRASGANNVEFNLGNISQFLNHSNGYTAPVINWSLSLVTNTYALTNGNVQFAVIASSSNTAASLQAWVTDTQPLTTVSDITPSKWNGLYSVIHSVGSEAAADTLQAEAPPGTNYININPSGTSGRFSFDYITSNGGQSPNSIPLLGANGGVSAKVTGVTPTTALFYEIDSHSTPEPAGSLVGSFTLSPAGALTFQAGPLLDAPKISSIVASNGIAAVTFNPKAAVKYRLVYSPQLTTSRTNWSVIGSPVAGSDNTAITLTDQSATNTAGFYSVLSYP